MSNHHDKALQDNAIAVPAICFITKVEPLLQVEPGDGGSPSQILVQYDRSSSEAGSTFATFLHATRMPLEVLMLFFTTGGSGVTLAWATCRISRYVQPSAKKPAMDIVQARMKFARSRSRLFDRCSVIRIFNPGFLVRVIFRGPVTAKDLLERLVVKHRLRFFEGHLSICEHPSDSPHGLLDLQRPQLVCMSMWNR